TAISCLVLSCSPFPALHGAKDRADGLEVNLLVERTTAEAQVEALTVPVLHGIDHLLRHAHSEGEVPAHLPHHDGGANVFCLDFDVLARYLFSDLQAVGSVFVPTILGAISKGSGELVHLCLVHFLVHTLLEALEDDGELWVRKEKNRVTTRAVRGTSCHMSPMNWQTETRPDWGRAGGDGSSSYRAGTPEGPG
uniref:Uncharacterized protein n=1 Tax=Aquila chrysaetos chrysaetos TaxID=223781 RepID=A0A663EF52_AQUCH